MKRVRGEPDESANETNGTKADVVMQGSICPPSFHEVDAMVRSRIHFSCATFTATPIVGCVASYSLKGALTFPLLPVAETAPSSPQRWCCNSWEDPSIPTHVNRFGLVIFRSSHPPLSRQETQPVAQNLLPQSLRSILPTSIEIPLSERAFGAVWATDTIIVVTIPCEERLVVVRDIRLDRMSTHVQRAPSYHPMPSGVVPLSITSSACSDGIWLCVSSLHDGIFVFGLQDDAALHLHRHIPNINGRGPFCPIARLVAFRLATTRVGHIQPQLELGELCLVAASPYDERLHIFHVASGQHLELEHNAEFSPLAISCAGESIVISQSFGSLTHVVAVDHSGSLVLQKYGRSAAPAVSESPVLLTNASLRRKRASFRRELMCALTMDGWLGLVERSTSSMRGFRWMCWQRIPALANVGAAFAYLSPPSPSKESESYEVLILSRGGDFTVVRIQL